MILGGIGGGNTQTGLIFEKNVDLKSMFLALPNYSLSPTSDKAGFDVYYNQNLVANVFQKHEFYKFLLRYNIHWKKHLSKKLLPDNGLFFIVRNTLFILEVKSQEVGGSVDEKLQTCDFKRKQYTKLVHSQGWRVEYVYILSEWFQQPKYKDTLDYILSVNCHYVFGKIPLAWFGLPS